jgi:hypothetical protein
MERSNFKKTVTEFAFMVTSYVTFLALQAAAEGVEDDDEDAEMLYLAAFYSRRLYNELATYTSIMEAQRTLRSPAVSVNLIETAMSALTQTMGAPLEEYATGANKGENKAFIKWVRMTPFKVKYKDPKKSIGFLEKEGVGPLPVMLSNLFEKEED